MNAYELADAIEKPMLTRPDCLHFGRTKESMQQIANMLRQQADRIAELELKLGVEEYLHKKLATTKPLSDEEIKQLAYQHRWNGDVDFARAIEERHGIK